MVDAGAAVRDLHKGVEIIERPVPVAVEIGPVQTPVQESDNILFVAPEIHDRVQPVAR